MGVGWFTSALIEVVGRNTLFALGSLCLLSFLRTLLRSDGAAIAAILLLPVLILLPGLFFGFGIEGYDVWGYLIQTIVPLALYLFVLRRFGLVAFAVMVSVEGIFTAYPMTLQSSLWYSPASYAALAVVAAAAIYAFRTSLGGQRILDTLGAEE